MQQPNRIILSSSTGITLNQRFLNLSKNQWGNNRDGAGPSGRGSGGTRRPFNRSERGIVFFRGGRGRGIRGASGGGGSGQANNVGGGFSDLGGVRDGRVVPKRERELAKQLANIERQLIKESQMLQSNFRGNGRGGRGRGNRQSFDDRGSQFGGDRGQQFGGGGGDFRGRGRGRGGGSQSRRGFGGGRGRNGWQISGNSRQELVDE